VVKIVKPPALRGEAWAQSWLANAYYGGTGVMQDYAEAAKWYRLAAQQGDAVGQSSSASSEASKMSLFSLIFGNKPKTAHLANERLQLIIAHERDGGGSSANFLPDLQRELIAMISKYVKVNTEDIRVSLEKQGNYEVLEVNIVLPEKG
jgi:cell division topological specificity factor